MFVIDRPLRFSQCARVLSSKELIAELRRQLQQGKFTQKAVADHLRIAPARVSEMLKGGRRVQTDEMAPLAKLLNVDGGSQTLQLPDGAKPVSSVPLLGEVPGGPWREAVRNASRHIQVALPGTRPHAYALTVSGDSMNRIVADGAEIIVDPDDLDLFDKWLYVVRNPDGEVTFKQYRDSPARLVPCSKNPAHETIPLAQRGFEIVGRVILITIPPSYAALD